MNKIELIIREGIYNGLPAHIIAEQVREQVKKERQEKLLQKIIQADEKDGLYGKD